MSEDNQRSKPRTSASQPGLGRRLRAIRREHEMSLADVAAAVDISASFLSLVEGGKSDITIGRLLRLLEFYRIPVTELLEKTTASDGIVRAKERALVEFSEEGMQIFLLTPDTRHKLNPTICEFAPHGASREHLSHEGEEFVHVLQGSIEIERENEEPIVLHKGDSVIFDPTVGHAYRNPGSKIARLLVVMTPPLF
jgi:quercetin dioxygenase-like cupin family protein